MSEPITNAVDAVRVLGALPVPMGLEPRDVEDELTGANLSLYEEELTSARLRLALASAQRGRRDLRARIAELEAELRTANGALDDAAKALRADRDALTVQRYRREVRDSYQQLAVQAREDRDYEGEAVVLQQLAERETVWAREDALAAEFAADPLALKPYVPGPSADASVDKLTRLLAPTQALREDDPNGLRHGYRLGRDLPETGGAR